MLGNLFKSMFGSSGETKAASSAAEVTYDSFQIIAEPQSAGGQWQVRGRIEKQVGDELKSHTFIRADTLPSETEAANEMIRKAKLMIDQQGDAIFN